MITEEEIEALFQAVDDYNAKMARNDAAPPPPEAA